MYLLTRDRGVPCSGSGHTDRSDRVPPKSVVNLENSGSPSSDGKWDSQSSSTRVCPVSLCLVKGPPGLDRDSRLEGPLRRP